MVVIGAFSMSSRVASSPLVSTTVQTSRPSVAVAAPSSPALRPPPVPPMSPIANAMAQPPPRPTQPPANMPAARIDPAPEVRAELERPASSVPAMTSSGPARAATAVQAYASGGSGGGGAPVAPPISVPGLERASASSSGNPLVAPVTGEGPSPVILAAGALAAGLVLWRVLHG